jgi:hypothetical protein
MKIKCPLCGFENEEVSKFCKNCNEPLTKYDEWGKGNVIKEEEKKIYGEIKKEELILKKAKGIGGDLELLKNKIRIKRKGGTAFLLHGLKGDKEIFLNQISSIQFKKAGFTSGYIQFAFMGGREAKGGVFQAASDENTIMFTKDDQEDFIEIKNTIEEQVFQFQNPDKKNDKTSLNIDDLEKLAKLKDEGIITEEEFQAKKRQILGI